MEQGIEPGLARYLRQIAFAPIGVEGQRRIRRASAVVVGVGALGSAAASFMVRAGIGRIRLVDRDRVHIGNLQRQLLFVESDAAAARPKVEAASEALSAANSQVEIEPVFGELGPDNGDELLGGVDMLLDGLDNFAGRWLINEYAVRTRTPYLHGAVAAGVGAAMNILPGRGPCLGCLWREPPGPDRTDDCHARGILSGLAAMLGAVIAAEAVKLITAPELIDTDLHHIDIWERDWTRIRVKRNPDCLVCGGLG